MTPPPESPPESLPESPPESPPGSAAARDIAEVPAIEVITTTALHLMSAAAVKCGLSDDEAEGGYTDLDEA
ncbi:MAG: DUF1844 domain-containing protein, partial [Actinomycetota bacterium]